MPSIFEGGLVHGAEAGLGESDGAGGFELALAEEVDLSAGGGVLGRELAEPAVDGVQAFDFPADGEVRLDSEDTPFLLDDGGELVDIGVGHIERAGLFDEGTSDVSECASDAVPGEGGELDIPGGVERLRGLDEGEERQLLEFFPGVRPLAFPGLGQATGQGDVSDREGLTIGRELSAGGCHRGLKAHGAVSWCC